MMTRHADVLPGDPKAIAALCRVARDLAQQMERAPERAHRLVWTSPTQARKTLADVKTLRRVAEAATALAEAHRQHTVPDLLDGIRKPGQLTLLLALPDVLDQDARKRLAAAGIPLARAKEASEHLHALVPTPDPRAELLEDLRLKRVEVGWTYRSDTSPAAIARAVEAAALQPGDQVLNPRAGLGDLAEALVTAYPDVAVTLVEEGESRRALLALLAQAYPGLHLTAEEHIAHYATRHARIVLRAPEGWRLQDVPLVQQVYHRLLLPGGRLVALMDKSAFTQPGAKARAFRAWVEGLAGQVEPLAGPTASTTLYLLVLDKPNPAQELLPTEPS